MEQAVGYLLLAFIGLFIQYLVITIAVRHGVVSAQKVLDKQAAKAKPTPAAPRHQQMAGLPV